MANSESAKRGEDANDDGNPINNDSMPDYLDPDRLIYLPLVMRNGRTQKTLKVLETFRVFHSNESPLACFEARGLRFAGLLLTCDLPLVWYSISGWGNW